MDALRKSLLLTLVISALGCQRDETPLPPVQAKGRFLSYAADEDIVVCEGTVPITEAWMEAVAIYLGMDPDRLLPTNYYFLDPSLLDERCHMRTGECTHQDDGQVNIYARSPVAEHELVHAIQFSAWPRRQPLLQEGLAMVFEQDTPPLLYDYYSFTSDEIDVAIEAESARKERSVYTVGQFLVYSMLTRYGPEAFEQFWYATSRPTTAADFRATFQDIFGESLDEMVADAEGTACAISVCVGEPLAWEQGTWATESPHSCADGAVVGYIGENDSDLTRNELMEITEAGIYDVSVSESTNKGQGTIVMSCQDGCHQGLIWAGESWPLDLSPGLYRVTTVASDPDEPGIRVEIRPSN